MFQITSKLRCCYDMRCISDVCGPGAALDTWMSDRFVVASWGRHWPQGRSWGPPRLDYLVMVQHRAAWDSGVDVGARAARLPVIQAAELERIS